MNKEQIETAAKEFLAKTSPDYSYQGKKWKDIKNYTFNEVVNFLQSMIDKGEVVEAEKYERLQIMYNLSESQLHETHVLLHDAKNSESTVSSVGKEVNHKLPDEGGWFDVNFKLPTLNTEYECILSDGKLIKLKYNSDLNTFNGASEHKHDHSIFVVKWRYIKSETVSYWISIKDRLPEPGSTVLWYLDDEIGIGFYDGIDKLACTYWMPLPLAPVYMHSKLTGE
jgi:hypothetical protein